ncbi:hypothetical protein BLX24_29155 [Arsenicibacter rosenii]|uniref:Uncharacterized protein n=2 Tax=Arsenicibacter rosenii TaxID=1750698 RepID=A0A1S2VA55_9BACT|nr:hypothetical protein BLX24_29155 [Arsenicibacter rosenii]
MNKCKDYEFEVIRLVFEDVISIRFVEEENVSSLLVNAALIKKVNGVIIVDFFPLFYGENDLRENVESDFMIKCRGIHYDEVNKEV